MALETFNTKLEGMKWFDLRTEALKHVEECTVAKALDTESESPKEVLRVAILAALKNFEDELTGQKFSGLVRVAKNVLSSEMINSAYDAENENPKAFLIDKILEETIMHGYLAKFKNTGFDSDDIGNEKKKQRM